MIINMQSGGVVPERILDAQTITPSTENQVIAAGSYLRGVLTVLGDADLIPANIKEGVNIFGVDGTPQIGLNVWRKSEIVTPQISVVNPSITFYDKDSDYYKWKFTANNFNLSQAVNSNNWKTFFDGFKADDNIYLEYKSYSLYAMVKNMYAQSIDSYGATDATHGYFERTDWSSRNNYTYTYPGTKIIQNGVFTPVGFIVHNNSNAYPNGGEKDGYWYELIGQVTAANTLSLSENTIKTIQADYRDQIETEVSNANA